MDLIRNDVWNGGFKHGDMENGVNGAEGFRKSERKGMGTCLGNDFEGAKILFGEFLGRSSRSEILGFNESLLSYFEFRSRRSAFICWSLISLLSFCNARA